MKHWYVVRCKPLQDARAEIHLRNQSFEVFRPLIRLRRRCGKRIRQVVDSLFPGYLFIQLDNVVDGWLSIRSTRGVLSLVRWGVYTPPVPQEVINEIRNRAGEDSCVDAAMSNSFQPQDRVRITDGPFAGCEGFFDRLSGDERVIVLLEIMQQAQRLVLSEQAIEHV